ncbi:sugar phosphate nucleotidyltransferase [Conexibacter sp. DBS9H8]|uniref:sugar phosphate nucleotidyltransferase n=1 Tax=Conexibacter sp. DBS9H8 TaxID=2937801 RepID=UPI00200E6942|nr:sugar phosphate nucleotidyltransferase [Conexibacter sp. DBS9H8]
MKGVILAGGKATRLRPLTQVTNKHLLPIYDKPLIFYPLEAMARAGVEEVLLITNPEYSGHFLNLIRSGREFGLRVTYELQEEPGGLAQAVGLAEPFARGSKILVLLGDNIFTHDLRPPVQRFGAQERGAVIFAKEVAEPQHYGVVELDGEHVLGIEEKPAAPRSNLAQTGIYLYDERVFSFMDRLAPSARGELEITDLNNLYVAERSLRCEILEGWWIDAGTSHDELLEANVRVAELRRAGLL